MPTEMNRSAKLKLWQEDVEWLLRQPRSLERDHIENILKWQMKQWESQPSQCEPETITLDRAKFEAAIARLNVHNIPTSLSVAAHLRNAILPDPPGGAQKRIAELEKALQDKCHELPYTDYVAFCDGCDQHQREQFGKCRTDEIARTVRQLRDHAVGIMETHGYVRDKHGKWVKK